ncbi:MAG: O-antigen ligase family protein [Endomicrobiia bacterium]
MNTNILGLRILKSGLFIYAISAVLTISGMSAGLAISLIGLILVIISQKNLFNQEISLEAKKVSIGILIFICLIIVSTIISYDFNSSIKRAITFIGEIAMFFVVINLIDDKEKEFIKRLIDIILVVSIVHSIYGILQYFTGLNLIGTKDVKAFHRVKGFLDHWNSLGGLLGMVFPLMVVRTFYEKNIKWIVGTILVLLCVFLTSTRGAWTGVVFSCFIIGIVSKRYRKLLFVSSGIVFLILMIPQTRNRIINTFITQEPERVYIWKTSIEVFKQKPIFGWGPDSLKKYVEEKTGQKFEHFHSHNIYFGMLQELGIFSFLIFCFIVFVTIKYLISELKKIQDISLKYVLLLGLFGGIIDILVHGLFDFSLRAETGYLFWFFLGVIFSL